MLMIKNNRVVQTAVISLMLSSCGNTSGHLSSEKEMASKIQEGHYWAAYNIYVDSQDRTPRMHLYYGEIRRSEMLRKRTERETENRLQEQWARARLVKAQKVENKADTSVFVNRVVTEMILERLETGRGCSTQKDLFKLKSLWQLMDSSV